MAKMKLWAVDVEIVVKRTLFVPSRKAGGAEAYIQTEEGWRDATKFDEEFSSLPRDMKVVRVREA